MVDFKKKPLLKEDVEVIRGSYNKYKDWHMDPNGYLLLRIDRKKKLLELGFCKKDNIVEIYITGKTPQDIYFEVAKRELLSRPEHYAYLGKELEKMYLALHHNLVYVQDDELNI